MSLVSQSPKSRIWLGTRQINFAATRQINFEYDATVQKVGHPVAANGNRYRAQFFLLSAAHFVHQPVDGVYNWRAILTLTPVFIMVPLLCPDLILGRWRQFPSMPPHFVRSYFAPHCLHIWLILADIGNPDISSKKISMFETPVD